MDKVQVIAAFDWLNKEEVIGSLGHDRIRGTDVYSFEYDENWLKENRGLVLSEDLKPFTGVQYNIVPDKLFGCFSDALPDRWGRKLIDLKAHLEQKKNVSPLTDWDYLKGVDDELRMGAFRFKDEQTGEYIGISDKEKVPPLLYLDDMVKAAHEIESKDYKQLEPEKKWIQRLFQPGTSMGGARPKACVKDNGKIYLAKFPSIKDEYDVSQWEYFASEMGRECGLNMAKSRLIPTEDGKHIFLSERFDRNNEGKRIQVGSSLSLLGFKDGDGERTNKGYLDIVDFIVSNEEDHLEQDLKELYRRVAFSICIGNSDDHFRNHSFLLTKKGWHLSPAYDINPSHSYSQSLMINEESNDSDLNQLYESHESYMIDEKSAFNIIRDVTHSMKYWESTARKVGMSKSEMDLFRERFDSGIEWKYGSGLHR